MDDTTIEALREVLLDMTTAIELISSGERSGAALIHFIEEMLKTIESWAVKYNVFLDDGSLAMNFAQGSQLNPQPNSHPNADPQSQEAVESLGLDQKVNESLDTLDPSSINQNSIEGEAVQELLESSSKEVLTGDVEKGDDGEGKMPSSEPGQNLNPVEASGEHSESKGNVIGSPNWLPEGWTTELRTVVSGSSANSKDKVYVDPTSKHHFRSKKEVLAFLNMGKRKRGRPKKNESLKDNSVRDAIDAAPSGSVHESVAGSNLEVQSPSNASPGNNMSSQVIVAASAAVVDTAKRKRGRPRKVDSVKKLSQAADQSIQCTNASGQAGDVPESVACSNTDSQAPSSICPTINETEPLTAPIPTSSGPLSSRSIPHHSGQPSEWLVYESLSSLPFPMFDQLRFVESNANKSTTNSPQTLWPWMLGNSEGLKKPFTDTKANDRMPNDESKQGEVVPISSSGEAQAGEVVAKRPKKAARKNAS